MKFNAYNTRVSFFFLVFDTVRDERWEEWNERERKRRLFLYSRNFDIRHFSCWGHCTRIVVTQTGPVHQQNQLERKYWSKTLRVHFIVAKLVNCLGHRVHLSTYCTLLPDNSLSTLQPISASFATIIFFSFYGCIIHLQQSFAWIKVLTCRSNVRLRFSVTIYFLFFFFLWLHLRHRFSLFLSFLPSLSFRIANRTGFWNFFILDSVSFGHANKLPCK